MRRKIALCAAAIIIQWISSAPTAAQIPPPRPTAPPPARPAPAPAPTDARLVASEMLRAADDCRLGLLDRTCARGPDGYPDRQCVILERCVSICDGPRRGGNLSLADAERAASSCARVRRDAEPLL